MLRPLSRHCALQLLLRDGGALRPRHGGLAAAPASRQRLRHGGAAVSKDVSRLTKQKVRHRNAAAAAEPGCHATAQRLIRASTFGNAQPVATQRNTPSQQDVPAMRPLLALGHPPITLSQQTLRRYH